MSTLTPTPAATLKARYGFRCEDLFELHEAMRDIVNRAKDAEVWCWAKDEAGKNFCVLPEHAGLLCHIMDELEQFIGDWGTQS